MEILILVIFVITCFYAFKALSKTEPTSNQNVHNTADKSFQKKPNAVYTPQTSVNKPIDLKFKDLSSTSNKSISDYAKDLKGVNDAFTGEPINIALGVLKCNNCKVHYHKNSFDVLVSENGGKCVSCLNTNITPITAAKVDGTEWINYKPEVVSIVNYRNYVGHTITFQGYVPMVLTSRDGRNHAVMFENKTWTKGFKMVILKGTVRDVGGSAFLKSLEGKTIDVRGLLTLHRRFGYQIVINNSNMILNIQ